MSDSSYRGGTRYTMVEFSTAVCQATSGLLPYLAIVIPLCSESPESLAGSEVWSTLQDYVGTSNCRLLDSDQISFS